ncbi:TetR/AcrR family transcriptional regulator [Blastococcus sp. TF02A-26]|uniref:TetR/AcrR family transcriptional regulator n=1 Tax=Blastococcus sp. TF02A-26 TaxID=2250577 RepID=UPI000DEA3318|nr:helix-turn-helix domain-containing protein [Blastococcus sp. TF02A-26]RBY89852.1 TetR/AcrR family transcriptional regulator [Blastococcus sp. TF02A-26]
MARPFRQQVDEGILDRAAALFARRGFAKTSVQDVADAVGLSKAGLLHHFPSKDALYAAVLAHAEEIGSRVLREVGALPEGEERDRRAVEALVDVALAHPGIVALMLAPASQTGGDPGDPPAAQFEAALHAFGVSPDSPDVERLVRVIGALAALAVLTLAAHAEDRATAWRGLIVGTCLDALGHDRPVASLPDHSQVEA